MKKLYNNNTLNCKKISYSQKVEVGHQLIHWSNKSDVIDETGRFDWVKALVCISAWLWNNKGYKDYACKQRIKFLNSWVDKCFEKDIQPTNPGITKLQLKVWIKRYNIRENLSYGFGSHQHDEVNAANHIQMCEKVMKFIIEKTDLNLCKLNNFDWFSLVDEGIISVGTFNKHITMFNSFIKSLITNGKTPVYFTNIRIKSYHRVYKTPFFEQSIKNLKQRLGKKRFNRKLMFLTRNDKSLIIKTNNKWLYLLYEGIIKQVNGLIRQTQGTKVQILKQLKQKTEQYKPLFEKIADLVSHNPKNKPIYYTKTQIRQMSPFERGVKLDWNLD